MYLLGQGRRSEKRRLRRDAGIAMAALLVMMNVMAILLTVALPVWKTAVKREREAELIWRGSQYARAVNLFRMKYANAYPPNVDILLKERFLRKKYKDPMTKDGEFQLLYAAQQQQRPGAGGLSGAAGQITPATPQAPVPLDPNTRAPAGATGGIMGVASKSTEASLKLFNGRSKYNEWQFTPQTVLGNRAAGAGAKPGAPGAGGGPGAQRPGTVGPGGIPGTARPGMPPLKPGMPRPPQ
jgi:hypothetical protein